MKDKYKYRILIVDDVSKNIQLVANILQREQYLMTFARNGKTALEHVNENDFDLILLDIMMPEMDGFEVCRQLKADERTKNIPIIFLTAKTEPDSIVKGFELGAVDYVTKPFNSAELLARVKTHIKLRTTEQELREANLTKDKFFSILAHDLRNPFQGLLGFAGLLYNNIDDYDYDKIKEFSQVIYEASEHAYSLLENLLQWSRSQMGRIEWKPEMLDIKANVNDVIGLLTPTARKKQISIYDIIPEGTMVYADSNMFKTIVRNLAFNSLKFTQPMGEVRISVQDKDKDYIQITVTDTGCGIRPEDMHKLFRIDVHHSTEGTGEEKGTALGLILCKEFVEKSGGLIWAESELGVGSNFRFTLPKQPEN
jgi:two-component system, sensor histidine kinase and response regulator